MAEYDIVARALSRLGQTASQIIPLRAEAEERKARAGLARTRTEFDIEQARETRVHRKRVWEAGEKPREVAKITARKQLEEFGRQKEIGEEPVTAGWVAKTMGIQDHLDLIKRHPKIQKGIEEAFAVKLSSKGVYEKTEGVPLLKGEIFARPDKFNLVDFINRDFVYQAESERDATKDPERKAFLTKMLESPGGKERLYRKNLDAFRSIQGAYGAIMPPGQQEVLKANIKRIEGKIDSLQKHRRAVELAGVKVKAKPPATIKFQYWDTEGKVHTQYISKGQVPGAEKQVRERGGSLQKPAKKKTVTITDYPKAAKAVAQILGQEPGEKTVEPTENQKRLIKQGLAPMGLDLVQRDRPIRKADKTIWPDPDTKKYWVIEPLGKKKGVAKPAGPRREKPGQVQTRKITRPEPAKSDPLGIR